MKFNFFNKEPKIGESKEPKTTEMNNGTNLEKETNLGAETEALIKDLSQKDFSEKSQEDCLAIYKKIKVAASLLAMAGIGLVLENQGNLGHIDIEQGTLATVEALREGLGYMLVVLGGVGYKLTDLAHQLKKEEIGTPDGVAY